MLRILLALTLLLPASLAGQARARTPQVEARLIPEVRSIQPGTPFPVALRLSVAPGWHIYAKDPGEVGLPTTVRWEGPAGFRAAPLRAAPRRWPPPERKELESLTFYAYQGEVVLLGEIRPPADLATGGRAEIAAQVGWGVCREVCIPQEVRLSVVLPVVHKAPGIQVKQP